MQVREFSLAIIFTLVSVREREWIVEKRKLKRGHNRFKLDE